jgi:hypothetical protein
VGSERVPEDYTASPEQAIADGQRLLDTDRPFHAHEVFEAVWKAGPPAERELWQGLAQYAVGLTHARRGNASGACALLTRAADRLDVAPARHSLEPAALARSARALAERIERDGLSCLEEAVYHPLLRAARTPGGSSGTG